MRPGFPYVMGFTRREAPVIEPPVKEEAVQGHVAVTYPAPRRVNVPVIGSVIGVAALLGVGGYFLYRTVTNSYREPPREPARAERQVQPEENPVVLPVIDLTPTAVLVAEPTSTVAVILPTAESTLILPTSTAEPVATSTPKPKATATVKPELKPFELVCTGCTEEQEKAFYRIAEQDVKVVRDVYGLSEGGMKLFVDFVDGGGYTFNFFIGNGVGGGGALGLGDFTKDPYDRGLKHEAAHAVNAALFGEDIPSWLDEGLAMYASGEVDEIVEWSKTHDGNFFWSTVKRTEDPIKYWSEAGGDAPGHPIGDHLFGLMVLDYGLTSKKNRTALGILADTYKSTGTQLTRRTIQAAYESALGTNLDPLFDFLKIGVQRLYTIYPDPTVVSEFND